MLGRLKQAAPYIAFLACLALFYGNQIWRSSQYSSQPTQKSGPQKRSDEKREGNPNETVWQWMTHDATGVFTLFLVLVGGAQLRFFFVQLRFIRESLDDAKIAADAAKVSADAAKRQVEIAEKSLTQLERPYVFIFGVKQIFREDRFNHFYVRYTVANFGKIPAIIEGAWIDWVVSERGEPPIPPLLHDGHSLMASPIMEAGEKRTDIRGYIPAGMSTGTVVVEIDSSGAPGAVVPEFNVHDGFDIFFRAVIAYRGPFSAGHETGATWLYYSDSFEFAVRGGQEYNYVK